MKINIFGEHMTVTDSIENYIKEKFSHLHAPEKLTNAEFRIGSTKTDKYVHFHAHIPGESLIINIKLKKKKGLGKKLDKRSKISDLNIKK